LGFPLLLFLAEAGNIGTDSWECIDSTNERLLTKFGGRNPSTRVDLRTPIPKEIQALLDTKVGPQTRCLAYSHVLQEGKGEAAFSAWLQAANHTGWYQRYALSFNVFRTKLSHGMYNSMVKNPEFAMKQREVLHKAVSRLDKMLESKEGSKVFFTSDAEGGGRRPTLAAIALAALMYPVTCPPEINQVIYGKTIIPFKSLPKGYQQEIAHWRSTRCGKLSLDLYKKYRLSTPLRMGDSSGNGAVQRVKAPSQQPLVSGCLKDCSK